MNKIRPALLSLMIATLFVVMAFPAQADEDVQVTLTASQSELRVGDLVELNLEVTHPAGYQVIIPALEGGWGPFEVRGQSPATTIIHDDGTQTTRQTITVTLFELGSFETPALPLTISDGAGGVRGEMTPPVALTVAPSLAQDDSALRDIRPQVDLKPPAILPWVLGGWFLAAVLIASGYWLYRRWRGESLFRSVIDDRPPYQVAVDELDRIRGLRLPEKGRFKEHYTLVTDCLRTYIEMQFHIHAFDRTTTELKHSLGQSTMVHDHVRRFTELFIESDFVKFAKLTPDLESARQLTDRARTLVELTRPVPEPEGGDGRPMVLGVNGVRKPAEGTR